MRFRGRLTVALGLLLCFGCAASALAEDGYELWLRYAPLDPEARARIGPRAEAIFVATAESPTVRVAVDELRRGLSSLLDREVGVTDRVTGGSIVLGGSELMAELGIGAGLAAGPAAEGYLIRTAEVSGHPVTLIAAHSDRGRLYGAFALLRHLQSGGDLASLDIESAPLIDLRVLNHWDNPDRTVERGYAGQSLWDWWRLPDIVEPRYTDYARANASIGINGVVLNNVNARAEVLGARYLDKVRALADVFRPYGIRVYLSADSIPRTRWIRRSAPGGNARQTKSTR